MIVKFLALGTLLLLVPFSAMSEELLDTCVNRIEKKYHSINALTSKFTQATKLVITDKEIKRQGNFFFKKGGQFKIEYKLPLPKTYSSNGKLLFIFTPNDTKDLIVQPLDNENMPPAAMSFLKGFEDLSKHYDIRQSILFTSKKDECVMKLVPKSKTKFKSLDVKFNKLGLLNELIINNNSGNISHYKFTNIETKKDLPDTLFMPPTK